MKSKFEAMADSITAMYKDYEAHHGKREAEKLGAKGLIAAFRQAATDRSPLGEIQNFVDQRPGVESNKSFYTNKLEKKFRYLRIRAHRIEAIRVAVGEGLVGGADAAWDSVVLSRPRP